ncbi:MAG: NAD-binding protein [Acidimicrobiales bacterium]
MKLAVNSLLHGLNVALAEALVLVEKAGIERSTAYGVFASGAVAAPFVLYKREAYEHPESTPVAFSLDLVAKDLELILRLAARWEPRWTRPRPTARSSSGQSTPGSGQRI